MLELIRYRDTQQVEMSLESGLQKSIDELYSVFAPYTGLSSRFGACDWLGWLSGEVFLKKPLKELTESDLSGYANNPWPCGDENDFKHFLPRLAELFIAGELAVTAEMFLFNLPYQNSPEKERQAVNRFLTESWLALMNSYPFPFEPDDFLCGLAQVLPDLSPFLDIWDRNQTLPALRQLCLFARHATYTGSWDNVPNQKQQIIDWLLNPRVTERLNNAASTYSDQPFYVEFLEAVEILTEWKNSYDPT
jgi:hypothetical protein